MSKNNLLEIQKVSSGYGSTTIVNNFSFVINKGQILTITGRNGMGKTTLMKTVMGLIEVRVGSIHFKNKDISKLNPSLRSMLGIGYVPQGREIFSSLTVLRLLQNIMEDRSGFFHLAIGKGWMHEEHKAGFAQFLCNRKSRLGSPSGSIKSAFQINFGA